MLIDQRGTLAASRRLSAFFAPILLAIAFLTANAAPARADKATVFMNRVARDLLAASRTPGGFQRASAIARVINKYADVRGIGNFALGRYKKQLRASQQGAYYNGMVRFMARYAAGQVPKLSVTKARVVGSSFPFRGQTGVDSRVTLRSGVTYDVRWLLVRRGSSFKVRDAEVFGFRMKELLRGLFVNHIEDKSKGGSGP